MLATSTKVIDICLAVETSVQDQVEFRVIQLVHLMQEIGEGSDIGDEAGKLPIGDRKLTFLSIDHGQIDLWQGLLVPVITPTHLFILFSVRGHRRDVTAQPVAFG